MTGAWPPCKRVTAVELCAATAAASVSWPRVALRRIRAAIIRITQAQRPRPKETLIATQAADAHVASQRTVLLEHVLNRHSTEHSGRRSDSRPFGFYWTRKDVGLASELISSFTSPDGVVLDPFLGSGSTSMGVQRAGGTRLGIGCEINEMPIRNLLLSLDANEHVDDEDVSILLAELRTIENLYRFTVDGTEFILTKIIHRMENQLVPTAFMVTVDGARQTLDENMGDAFRSLLEAYQARIDSLPTRPDSELQENSRIAVRSGMRVSSVFGPLAFECLSILRDAGRSSLLVRLVLASGLHLCRLTDAKSQSQFPYWHPKQNIHEKSVHGVMLKQLRAFQQLTETQRWFDPASIIKHFKDRRATSRPDHLILKGDCTTRLRDEVPDACVDLVLTDPPYFDQVAYSEYLKLWEHFTGFQADLDAEIVESSRVGGQRSRARYLTDLEAAFREVRRTLKPHATVLVYFKDSKPRNVHDFISSLGRAGLTFIGQRHLPKPSFTYKQNATKETTVGGDSIMVFVPGDAAAFTEPPPRATRQELDKEFLQLFRAYVAENGPSSLTEALDNRILQATYQSGYLAAIPSSAHFADVIRAEFTFDATDRRWRPNS